MVAIGSRDLANAHRFETTEVVLEHGIVRGRVRGQVLGHTTAHRVQYRLDETRHIGENGLVEFSENGIVHWIGRGLVVCGDCAQHRVAGPDRRGDHRAVVPAGSPDCRLELEEGHRHRLG